MIKKYLLTACMALLTYLAGTAQNTVRYGYCPEKLDETDMVAQGTGKNKFVEARICLDPQTDPVMQRLKGHQIKGVRAYLRDEYKQAVQKRSFVVAGLNTPEDEAAKKFCNFEAGWNEVLFDEPLTIGDDKLFVGFQVYETIGSAYPLLSMRTACVPGGCWVNLGREGWNELTDRGTLLIQAILDDEAAAELDRCAYAQLADFPLTVVPDKEFRGTVYFQNISDKAVNSLTLQTIGEGDDAAHTQEVTFSTPLAPYDGRVVALNIHAGQKLGTSVPFALNVVNINGEAAQAARPGVSNLYTTHDAFVRIPLIEEFTSQRCPNCPFMMYYLEKAREQYDGPLLYVTHHTGFQNDKFTLPGENELEYLFGEGYPFNPAIMYDRTYFPQQSAVTLSSTGEPSPQPYLDKFTEMALRPAMAEVIVDVTKTATDVACRVHGRVNKEMASAGDPLYLTAYLVEDGLSVNDYPQDGLDVADAPEDLKSTFRHNGIIRHSYTTNITGDALSLTPEATFSVDFPAAEWKTDWKWENCQVIAFVHKYNKSDLTDNTVLNAGSNRYNYLINGIDGVQAEAADPVRVFAGADGRLRTSQAVSALQVFTPSGAQCNADGVLRPGVYVVRAVSQQGAVTVSKIVVK